MTQIVATGHVSGQAKGRLIERCDINADRAFMLVIRVCRIQQMTLRDVAEQLVSTG